MTAYLAVALFAAAFCLLAKFLSKTVLTAPMAFIAFGIAVHLTGWVPLQASEEALHLLAEVALIILLFIDAAKIDGSTLRQRHIWPMRMLLIGLPLSFIIGTGLTVLILPGLGLAAAALVAAILMPTDAALGQPVLSNPNVPERARRALTVESGLNDGLALPLVLFMAAAAATLDGPAEGWARFVAAQLVIAPLVGLALGCIGGWAMIAASERNLTSAIYEGIAALSLAFACYLAATLLGGNGFIAAFVGGLGFGAIARGRCAFVYEFSESEGQALSWAAFFLLGALLVPEAAMHLDLFGLAVILGSLFIVRPLAIWLSLVGTDAAPLTRLFFGWFGPRGLATALFALLVVDRLPHGLAEDVLHLAVNAVWISAVLHGISAAPGAAWFGRSKTAEAIKE